MSELEIAKWIAMAILSGFVWFLRRTVDSYDNKFTSMENKLKATEESINKIKQDYLHRDDFKEFKIELRLMFEDLKQDIRALK